MLKKEAEILFKSICSDYKDLDKYMQRWEWAVFTDGLCKSGEITQKQFSSWDYPRYFKKI